MQRYRITFVLDAQGDVDLALREIDILLQALARTDEMYLQAHREVGPLRDQGISLTAEPQGAKSPGQEDWQDVSTLLVRKADGRRTGSDRDLSCLRAAELRLQGDAAVKPHLLAARLPSGVTVCEAVVVRGDGRIERTGVGQRPLYTRQRITFVMGLFDGDEERELSERVLQVLLDALTEIDCLFLARHPNFPDIYSSGVRYMEEPPMQEDWQDAPTCIRMGKMDCDDAACWLTAQRRVRDGIAARSVWTKRKIPKTKSYLYHILTKHPNGRTEDPSFVQGMR